MSASVTVTRGPWASGCVLTEGNTEITARGGGHRAPETRGGTGTPGTPHSLEHGTAQPRLSLPPRRRSLHTAPGPPEPPLCGPHPAAASKPATLGPRPPAPHTQLLRAPPPRLLPRAPDACSLPLGPAGPRSPRSTHHSTTSACAHRRGVSSPGPGHGSAARRLRPTVCGTADT